ncbi:MAG: PTS sugar transporter subunit IIA [Anaerolineae bacterium]|nr:PTS sugar transporter subunit IIA [Anaerolineae bacterium]
MSIIVKDLVRLNAQAADKHEAIKMAGELLVKAGRVKSAYVEGMLAREKTMSTYMGNGVAIPHGEFENRADIIKTGISVVQFPAGVAWEDDELAYLVIGIAATENEHVGVLANLAEVIEEPEDAELLARTTDAMFIVERLSRPVESE